MRRVLGAVMMAGLLMGGAACGSSDSTTDGASSTNSGSEDVQAYCDAVDDYITKFEAAQDDPAKGATLDEEGVELTKKAEALGTSNLGVDDARAVAECSKKAADLLSAG